MIWQRFKNDFLIKFWNPVPTVIAAGIISVYYFGLTGTYWAVTGEFTRWGGEALESIGVDVSQWGYFNLIGLEGNVFTRIDGVMILGMFAGCIAAALWANNIKLRRSKNKIRIAQALVGGMIAGFGARLAMGCNLASFFTGIPQFSFHAWLFTIATAIGCYFGAKFTLLPLFRIPVKLEKVQGNSTALLQQNAQQVKGRFRLGMLIFCLFLAWSLYTLFHSPKLGFAMLCGLAFGLLIERGQICFTSAFRDLFITGRTTMAKAIIYGILVSSIGVYSYIAMGATPKIMWAGPNAILGGLLFGFGIVLAGGCETGWMYRAVEGQVHYMWVGIGNVLGATLLAYWWDSLAPVLALDYDKINLLQSFGAIGGLMINYALLIGAFILVLWWEQRFFRQR